MLRRLSPHRRLWGAKTETLRGCGGKFDVAEAGGELSDFRSERFDIRGRGTFAGNPLIDEPMHPITAAIETKHVD
jgi:hypothetical protein